MLEPQAINLIITPLVAGVVGYITNKLAIKMLFRPYKPKWYTLGWQGIVPKTRPKLAEKMSEIVGQKLLGYDDISYSLENDDVKLKIHSIIASKLRNLNNKDIYALIRLLNLDNKLIQNSKVINEVVNNIIKLFIDKVIEQEVNIDSIRTPINDIIQSFNIENLIDNQLNTTVTSILKNNKPLKDMLPEEILEQKNYFIEHITITIMTNIRRLGKSDIVKDVLSEKLINLKDNMMSLSSGLDILKAGFFNLFLSDDKIKDVIDDELPNIMADISNNTNVYKTIYKIIEDELDNTLKQPVSEITKNLSLDDIQNITLYIKKYFLSGINISDKISSLIFNSPFFKNIHIKDILILLNIDVYKIIKFDIIDIVNSKIYEVIKPAIINKTVKFININYNKISNILTQLIIKLIKHNLKYVLSAINIKKIVKDKINSLPLQDVEKLLFSFMKEHFKWINILGFFIGLVIGLIQALVIFFMKN